MDHARLIVAVTLAVTFLVLSVGHTARTFFDLPPLTDAETAAWSDVAKVLLGGLIGFIAGSSGCKK